MHEHALHLRRQVPGLLVDRNDASGVQRLVFRRRRRPLSGASPSCGRISYCGFCSCRPCDVSSSSAEQDDALMRAEDVVQERLVEPDRAQGDPTRSRTSISKILNRGRRVGRMPAADDFTDHRGGHAGLQRGDRLKVRRGLRSGSGKRYSRSSIVCRPTRCRSAARRGPTPLRY